jgi:hypothetical protein
MAVRTDSGGRAKVGVATRARVRPRPGGRQGAGVVTPVLAGAFRDPVVAAARRLELLVFAAILVLMVTKPF